MEHVYLPIYAGDIFGMMRALFFPPKKYLLEIPSSVGTWEIMGNIIGKKIVGRKWLEFWRVT